MATPPSAPVDSPQNRLARLNTGSPVVDPKGNDLRSPAQRDRDRIIYTSAFRRLQGVTQVVGPLEGHVFHNRLTHTIEVAQLARRLAERLSSTTPEELVAAWGGLDPDTAEAAALAHDIGHPPFGHIAEERLNELASRFDSANGFEGNAQSFRIVTRLAAHAEGYKGLDLTRGTLNAILKYPWLRGAGPVSKAAKWGAYTTEADDYEFARAGQVEHRQSLEAAIMDHADSIAYSVHDLDDFYRAGLIPLSEVLANFDEQFDLFKVSGKVKSPGIADRHKDSVRKMLQLLPTSRAYTGTYEERVQLRAAASKLINGFISSVDIADATADEPLKIPPARDVQMRFLQNVVWRYVITDPRLATQQRGQQHIVDTLFEIYRDALEQASAPGGSGAARESHLSLVPSTFRSQAKALSAAQPDSTRTAAQAVRIAVDIVASFTDSQAVALYRRLTGVASGSVTELIDR